LLLDGLLTTEPFFPFFFKRKYLFFIQKNRNNYGARQEFMLINSLLIGLILVELPA